MCVRWYVQLLNEQECAHKRLGSLLHLGNLHDVFVHMISPACRQPNYLSSTVGSEPRHTPTLAYTHGPAHTAALWERLSPPPVCHGSYYSAAHCCQCGAGGAPGWKTCPQRALALFVLLSLFAACHLNCVKVIVCPSSNAVSRVVLTCVVSWQQTSKQNGYVFVEKGSLEQELLSPGVRITLIMKELSFSFCLCCSWTNGLLCLRNVCCWG